MNTDHSPVIARVQKMLALAATGSGATEAEAAVASAMVQDLLQKHGLTMMQVEAAGGSVGAEGKRSKEGTDRRALYKWQQALMAALADNNFCIHLIEIVRTHDGRKERRSKQHVLIGRWVNVQTTVITYDYLSQAIKRAADDEGFLHDTATEADRHLFLDGAVDRLTARLRAKRLEAEREAKAKRDEEATKARHPGSAPGTALVLSDVYSSEADANEDFRNGRASGTTAANRARDAARRSEAETMAAKLEAEGVEEYEAWYRAWGYSEVDAKKYSKQFHDRAKREQQRGSTAEERRNWARQSSRAYQTGERRANDIGLDAQIDSRTTTSCVDNKRRIG